MNSFGNVLTNHTAEWIFKVGYPLYEPYKNVEKNSEKDWEYIFKILNKYGVKSHSIFPISKYPDGLLQASFAFRKGNLGLTMDCYQRQTSESGKVYEYWHKKLYCRGGCKDQESFTAILTVANGMYSERMVIHQSNKFIPHYQYADGIEIDIPITPDMAGILIEDIRLYPAAFKGSPFEGRRVKMDKKVGWVWVKE